MPGITLSIDLSRLRGGANSAVSIVNNISIAAERAQVSLSGVGQAADSSISGIKRLASQILALVGAYKALETATAFLQRGIEFGSSMETSRIGIASLVSTMTEIRDAQGNVLEGQEKYNAAMGISTRLMERIQILGLETTATSQELVQGVQSIIAPALQAGIALDKLPDFAVQSAQAMQAMGIPLQQMRTEIEAMLTGNINKAQDLLAPRLGLNAEDIRSWKEQGILIDKLMARLKMFEMAGQDVARTWTGIKSNFSEAIDILAGQISSGLTENLKQALTQMQNLMVSINKDTGKIGISEDFVNIKNAAQELSTMLGEQIVSATQTLITELKDLNSALKGVDIRSTFSDGAQSIKEIGGALAGAMLAYKAYTAVVNSATASTLQAFRADAQSMGVRQALRETILSTNAATYQKIQTERQAAQSALSTARADVEATAAAQRAAQAKKQAAYVALERARAEEAEAAAAARGVGITAQQEAAFRRLVIAERAYTAANGEATAATNALSTSQGVLTAATTRAAAATKGATALQTAWVGLKSSLTGLMGIFGGPLGAAFTAAGAAALYLATRQTEAEQAATLHEQALRSLEQATKGTAQAQKNLADKTSDAAKALRDIAAEKATAALEKQINTISDALEPFGQRMIEMGDVEISVGDANVKSLLDMIEGIKNGTVSVEEFKNAVAEMRNNFKSAGQEGHSLGRILTSILDGPIANLEKYAQTVQEAAFKNSEMGQTALKVADAVMQIAAAADGAATAVGNLNNEFNALDPKKLKGVIENLEFKKYASTLSERQKAEAQAMKQAGASINSIRFAMSDMVGPMQPELYDLKKLAGEAYTPSKSASRGASQVENARRSLEALRAEIAKLNGESSAADVTLTKKYNDIERIGKSAKLSSAEIANLRTEYANAFKADTLKSFNKELLQLEGNTSALRSLEITDTTRQWEMRLREAGLSAEETEQRIIQLRAALEKQSQFKDIQTAASFYKDLAQRTGEFNIGLEYQNHLIQEQANAWLQAGIPMQDVVRMQQLMTLEMSRAPWDGMVRGLNKFGAEATNTAAQLEGALTNAFDSASDALADFVMKGKIDFNSLANSMISDLARIASRQAMGSIASGLGSMLGGLFNSPFSASSGASMANTVMDINNGMMNVFGFHSGGMAWESPTFTRAMPVSSFEDAPRFHSGRLPWDPSYEVPAIIRRDESVLTPGQMRTLAGMGEERSNRWDMAAFTPQQMHALGARDASSVEININPVVIDRTERGVSASVNQTSDGMGNLRFEVIIDEIDRRMAQRTQNRQSQTANAINKVNGLNSANSLYRS